MGRFSRIKGREIENNALQFLESRGLNLISCNYTTRAGEIDLIMRDHDTVVFVEIRYRKSNNWGSAAESIDQHKQAKIIAASQHYLGEKRFSGPVRFDVVTYDGQTNKPSQWIKNAFEVDW